MNTVNRTAKSTAKSLLTAPGSEAMSLGATRCACRHPTTVTILCLNPLDSMETPPHKAMVGCDELRESHRQTTHSRAPGP